MPDFFFFAFLSANNIKTWESIFSKDFRKALKEQTYDKHPSILQNILWEIRWYYIHTKIDGLEWSKTGFIINNN